MTAINSDIRDLRSLRPSKGMGHRELALRAGVSQRELSQCERGLAMPNPRFFTSIAKVLEVSVDTLRDRHVAWMDKAVPGEGYTTAIPEASFVKKPRAQPTTHLSILDLFCGTGGFSHGFELTGQFQVTLGIDLLPDRIETFAENHAPAYGVCGDIRQIDTSSLIELSGSPDVIIGGPPCQGFSSIRPFRTLTEGDSRNNLFEHFALIVNACKPKWFVLENVVGLITHKNSETIGNIVSLFESLGYKTEWKVLNAALYGLPQRRERLFVIGNSQGKSLKWPAPTHYDSNGRSMAGKRFGQELLPLFGANLPPAVTVMDAIHDLPEVRAGDSSDRYRVDVALTEYERRMRANEQVLTLHEATRHTTKMLEIIRQAGYNRYALPEGLTTSGFSSSYSRLEPDKPSVTLTVNFVHPASNKCIHPYQDRALTPREGARLQGFEDSYKFAGNRAHIVKQIGNAVPPLLGKVIAGALLEQL